MEDDARPEEYPAIVAALDPAGAPCMTFVRRAAGNPSKIAVLSASFNPPTLAHLRMAELAHVDLGYPEVVLELAIANVDKAATDAPLHERMMMMRAIAEPRPWLSIAVATHGRFLDKMTALRTHFPTTDVCFIVGYDTLVRVFDPKYYTHRDAELRALFDQTSFACANRERAGDDALRELLLIPTNAPYAEGVRPMALDSYHAGLSSTSVRISVAAGQRRPDGLPEEVAAYLDGRRLYTPSDGNSP